MKETRAAVHHGTKPQLYLLRLFQYQQSETSIKSTLECSAEGKAAAVTCLVGEGVVQPFAQRGGGERQGGLDRGVRLHVVLRRRAGSRHPVHIRLPLTYGQLLPQVWR